TVVEALVRERCVRRGSVDLVDSAGGEEGVPRAWTHEVREKRERERRERENRALRGMMDEDQKQFVAYFTPTNATLERKKKEKADGTRDDSPYAHFMPIFMKISADLYRALHRNISVDLFLSMK